MSNHTRPRPSVKAIIIENSQLLVLKMQDEQGIYYKLPGGGQERFETMQEALIRECAEEINLQIEPGALLWLADHIFNQQHETKPAQGHQTEAFFRCYIKGNAQAQVGHIPDNNQIGIAWLPLNQLEQLRLYPFALRPLIGNIDEQSHPNQTATYIGKIS